ncbi:MAG: DNA repair protein RecO [Eubacterium sp.]|nr:DNA repair protein RecO [Eubacterium sp.]
MLVTVKGIVIGRREIGDNNCFLDVFTDKLGMVEVMAHGVKKLGGRNSAAASMFSYADFCLNKKGTSYYTINSTEPIYNFYDIANSLEAFSLAVYFADLIKYCATSEEEHGELLRFVCMAFYQLEKAKLPLDFIKSIFEFRFITHIGFMPDLRACQQCACYTDDVMYFLPNEGMIYCENCFKTFVRGTDSFQIDPTVLHILRYVAYSDNEKLFKFKISPKYEKIFSDITEFYLQSQLGRTFDTLRYYKDLQLDYFNQEE